MKRPRVIGIAINLEKGEAPARLRELITLLESNDCRVLVERGNSSVRRTKVSLRQMAQRADMIFVLGGDGTILRVAQGIEGAKTPILGVNLGRLGFLTGVRSDEMTAVVQDVLRGRYTLSRRQTITAILRSKKGPRHLFHGLNDVVIGRASSSRVVRLSVSINGEWLTEYTCDGMVFATATGSTAYSLSAGGPILLPTAKACVITPICPHALSNRALIVDEQAIVGCEAVRSADNLLLTVDGQEKAHMRIGDHIEVKVGSREVRLVMPRGHKYFEVLRKKLKWSGSNV